jgi:RNA 2',3'-cyclic 3'-phosphodiesterase
MTSLATLAERDEVRLFLGLPLPEETLRRLVEWQGAALGGVAGARIVPRENLHITLAFLGGRPGSEIAAIAAEIRSAAAAAGLPSLTASRYRETRSVGMLVLDDPENVATRLAKDLHRRLKRLRVYEPERRPWLPHLTVLRFRERPRLTPALPDLGVVSPSEVALYHSVLRPTGAQYEVLESVALGG